MGTITHVSTAASQSIYCGKQYLNYAMRQQCGSEVRKRTAAVQRTIMAGWLRGICVSACWFVSPQCGFSLSLFCNYSSSPSLRVQHIKWLRDNDCVSGSDGRASDSCRVWIPRYGWAAELPSLPSSKAPKPGSYSEESCRN